ncbi:cobalamin-dependent protein [Planktomarina sp.]|nr:cobalamin-dependent protein [Planktomarina sp.]
MSKQQGSASGVQSTDAFEWEVYHNSETNIFELSKKLPEDLVASLAREVILRVASRTVAVARPVSQEELLAFSTALASDSPKSAAQIIAAEREAGRPAEDIYVNLLAPAARQLGDMWDSDHITFAQVTVGSGRIFAIMRSMRHMFETSEPAEEPAVIFASVPGETHTLGVRMAADFFRTDGWNISLLIGLSHDDLLAEIAQISSRMVGLSFSGEHSLEALSQVIVALHICAPHLSIVICGQEVEEFRPILELMGVDGIAVTMEDARAHFTRLSQDKT